MLYHSTILGWQVEDREWQLVLSTYDLAIEVEQNGFLKSDPAQADVDRKKVV